MIRLCSVFLLACAGPDSSADRAQLPPVLGGPVVEAWLAEGWYHAWTCERTSTFGQGHSLNRVCSNALAAAAGPGEFPVDAASVKEMFDAEDRVVVGIAVARHTRPGAGGDTWYWYERVALDSMLPHDRDGIVADGWGDAGGAAGCVECHRGAGSDANHSGHDMVYTVAR
jgi:hypothetical protein